MSFFKNLFGRNDKPENKEFDLKDLFSETAKIKRDLTTPEGAILTLEEAYSQKNLDKVLACKDFNAEAKFMLEKMMKDGGGFGDHPALREQTTKALRLSFIRQLNDNGYPDFTNVKRAITKTEKKSDEQVIVSGIHEYPDKRTLAFSYTVIKTADGWKVLNSPE